jgi:protoheme IX farnesyltransferase
MSTIAEYIALTKPRLLPLVLFSGLPALVMAQGRWPSFELAAWTLLGTALAAGAASALNSYLERDRDAQMERTRLRPLPAGKLDPRGALLFGLGLSLAGTGVLWAASGPAAAMIALSAILFYVFVYTLWLKPRTSFAVVVGGVSGAIAPLIADAAVNGHVSVAGWLLFSIIFIWQPPHFYAIALYRKDDYAEANFPMLHDRIGEDATRTHIVAWILALIPFTLAPVALGMLGPAYGVIAGALGVWFLAQALVLRERRDRASARRTFWVSLIFLGGTFTAMIGDLVWRTLA